MNTLETFYSVYLRDPTDAPVQRSKKRDPVRTLYRVCPMCLNDIARGNRRVTLGIGRSSCLKRKALFNELSS